MAALARGRCAGERVMMFSRAAAMRPSSRICSMPIDSAEDCSGNGAGAGRDSLSSVRDPLLLLAG